MDVPSTSGKTNICMNYSRDERRRPLAKDIVEASLTEV